MKTKKDIEIWSNFTVEHDSITKEKEIIEFDLTFKGDLSEWLQEYLDNPKESRLHKNLVKLFSRWLK